jgi:hypothetical protein
MSTVRFSKVLEACGKPDIHLLLIDPAKDKTLQAAIKSDRVMTLYQSGGTDHGVVGFEQGRSRQFLVFPKPLKSFSGQRIVGIKYELLEDSPAPKKETVKREIARPDEQPAEQAPTLARTKGAGGASAKQADRQTPTLVSKSSAEPEETAPAEEEKVDQESRRKVSEDKVIKFQRAEPTKSPEAEADQIKKIKRQVREAMDALEQGKQVVAFNLLKRILDADKSG